MTDKSTNKILNGVFELLETLFSAFFVTMLVFTYLLRFTTVDGESMRTSLDSGDRLLVSLICPSPKIGDIVVIKADKKVILDDNGSPVTEDGLGINLIKRVIACEGQTVDIDFQNGIVRVDGEKIYEDYLHLGLTHKDEGAFTGRYPVTVPEGCVFVMGDNRSVSKDSRSPDVAFVPEECIAGKVLLRVSPLERFGTV